MKGNQIRLRVTDEEKQVIFSNAKEQGMSASEYIRKLATSRAF
jgi:uncharacterized protein (DUF1778 family)|tara:strand:- start:344 stop:472 length:129 start_codon:yes stop_codon:yes gene_type:complete